MQKGFQAILSLSSFELEMRERATFDMANVLLYYVCMIQRVFKKHKIMTRAIVYALVAGNEKKKTFAKIHPVFIINISMNFLNWYINI